jgi:sugar phosphate isomerase/epimerase
MKFGWAIWNMTGCPQADKCRLASELGLDFVSFNTSPLKWAQAHPGGEAATPALLAELGLGWTLHAGLFRVSDGDSKLLAETLAFAEEAGPPLVVSFDPVVSGEKPDRRYEPEATARGLERALESLGGLDTGIALENGPLNCEPEGFLPLAERFDRLGLLLDTGHLNMFLGADPGRIEGYLDALPLPIVDLHLHDNDGEHDQHLPLGAGTLPYPELFAALRARGHDGPATLEVTPHLKGLNSENPADVESLRNTLALARDGLSG